MGNEARKTWINTEVLKMLDAAHVLMTIAYERANVTAPGGKRAVMPAPYRNEIEKLKTQIARTRTKFTAMKVN